MRLWSILKRKISSLFAIIIVIIIGFYFLDNYNVDSPKKVAVEYSQYINRLNFEEANKYIANNRINYDNRISAELIALKSLCSDLSTTWIKTENTDNKDIKIVTVEEEVCDYQGVILFFYKEEFNRGFSGEIELSKREERFMIYIDSVRQNPDSYRFKELNEYKLKKTSKGWKIIYDQ